LSLFAPLRNIGGITVLLHSVLNCEASFILPFSLTGGWIGRTAGLEDPEKIKIRCLCWVSNAASSSLWPIRYTMASWLKAFKLLQSCSIWCNPVCKCQRFSGTKYCYHLQMPRENKVSLFFENIANYVPHCKPKTHEPSTVSTSNLTHKTSNLNVGGNFHICKTELKVLEYIIYKHSI